MAVLPSPRSTTWRNRIWAQKLSKTNPNRSTQMGLPTSSSKLGLTHSLRPRFRWWKPGTQLWVRHRMEKPLWPFTIWMLPSSNPQIGPHETNETIKWHTNPPWSFYSHFNMFKLMSLPELHIHCAFILLTLSICSNISPLWRSDNQLNYLATIFENIG